MSKLKRRLNVIRDTTLLVYVFALVLPAVSLAQTCPFDDGRSSLAVEGLVLTRYALGLIGAPLVANSGIAIGDAQTVEDSINSQAFDLRLTSNAVMTPTDATIISRKLAGFVGTSLTAGLALGNGTRSTPAAVQSFLLAGCPGTAWVQGGNAFGVPGVIGTTDAQHEECFVWAGVSALPSSFYCTAPNPFLVRADGGVGINTSDPAGAQLHVVGSGDATGTGKYEALFSSNNDTQIALRSASSSGKVWTLQSSAGFASGTLAGSFQIIDRSAPAERFRIETSGITRNGSGVWGTFPDARLKKNIRDLDAPLETFLKLRGHRFEYKNPAAVMATPGERLGFVAQEVQHAVPQWVHSGPDGLLSIVPTGFDALVVEAVRALRTEKNQELAQLRALLAELRHTMDALMASATFERRVAVIGTRISESH